MSARALLARYYDPQTGQFLSVDAKVQQTLEAYNYVGDDPVNEMDPSGMAGGGPGPTLCGQQGHNCTGSGFGWVVDAAKAIGQAVESLASFVVRVSKTVWAHREVILKVVVYTAGFLAAVACTLATDGLCGVVFAGMPIGEVAFGALSGALSGAAIYATSGGSKSASGYLSAAEAGSGIGVISGLPSGIAGLFLNEGKHAAPTKFFPAFRDLAESLVELARH